MEREHKPEGTRWLFPTGSVRKKQEIADCKRIAETLELIEQRCAMPPVGPVILRDTTLHVSCSVATIDIYMLRKIQQST